MTKRDIAATFLPPERCGCGLHSDHGRPVVQSRFSHAFVSRCCTLLAPFVPSYLRNNIEWCEIIERALTSARHSKTEGFVRRTSDDRRLGGSVLPGQGTIKESAP